MRYIKLIFILLLSSSLFSSDEIVDVKAEESSNEVASYKKLPTIGSNEFTSLSGNNIVFDDLY